MNLSSRVEKSIRNVITGFTVKLITIAMSFIDRTLFIKFIGEEMLGINGLFSNVLLMLSLADLGMASVMSLSYYEPLAKNDTKKVAALNRFYKKIYNSLAIIIFTIGVCIIPFLKYIIKLQEPINNLEGIYLLFLLNTVISYLFVYTSNVLIADQNSYIASRIQIITDIAKNIVLCIVLVVTKNIFIYLIVKVFFTFLYNLIVCKYTEKKYVYLGKKEVLDDKSKKDIIKTIKAGFVYKLSSVMLNGTDNIIISTVVGTVWVGYLSNYDMIITAITSFVIMIFSSFTASVGNLNVTDTKKRKRDIFEKILFLGMWISKIIIPCLFYLIPDLLRVWLGERYILPVNVFIAKLIVIYLFCCLNPIYTFRDALGLYKKTKYSILLASILNVVLSIILGSIMGMFGVLIASSIAMVLTYFWYEPVVLYSEYFDKGPKSYFLKHIINIIQLLIIFVICSFIIPKIVVNSFIQLIIKAIICFTLTNLVCLILNLHRSELKFYISKLILVVRKMNAKLKYS